MKKQNAKSPRQSLTKLRKNAPISSAYPVIDTDLARDNIENDLTDGDKQDL